MDAVPADGRTRASANRRGTLVRACVSLLAAACGLVLTLAPPALWLNAAPDERPATPSRDEKLADVRVEGNTTIPAEHIAKFIRTRPGRPYNERQIRDDVRNLYGKRWFYSVEPRLKRTKKGLVLIFHVIERPVVTRVVYKGNKGVTTKKLSSLTGLKPGSPFDVSANRQSVRRILEHYKQEGYAFTTVKLLKGGDRNDREVVFQIEEGPKVRVISTDFVGNEFVSGAVLRTRIRTSRAILWIFGGLYDPETIKDDIAALKTYYHNLGFFDVQVKQTTAFNQDRSRAYFTYHIKEGKRYKVRRVIIAGNRVIDTATIRNDLKLVEGVPFNSIQLAKDVDGIKDKYGDRGRLFAKIDASPRFFENQEGLADLVYRIDEDAVYRIRRINVVFRDPNSHTKRSAVLNRMLIHPGDLANPKLIQRSKKKIGGIQVFDPGRSNPAIGPQIIFKAVKPTATKPLETFRGQSADEVFPPNSSESTPASRHPLSRDAAPAPAATSRTLLRHLRGAENPFEIIDRRGAPQPRQTRPDVPDVLDRRSSRRDSTDALPFTDGPPTSFYMHEVTSRQVVRGQNIERGIPQPGSPLFDNDPNRPVFPPAIREGDLDVVVSETQTGRLMFGVGVNSDAGIVGSIVLNEYNFDILRPPRSFQDLMDGRAFRGGAQRFRIEAVPGNIVSRYLVSWTDPYIFDTDYSLSLSGFYYNRYLPDWTEQRTGGRVAVGRQFTPYLSASAIFRAEDVQLSDPHLPTPQFLLDSLGSSLLTTVGFSVAHDTRDQAFLPGEGHLVEFQFEQAVGDFQYPKLTLDAQQYFTVYQRPDGRGRHILVLRGQLGWTDVGTPIFERFYAGGFQTFRGFQFRGVSPRELDVGIGGRWLALGSAEYMVPLMAEETIHGVAFTDFGTVEKNIGFQDFRVSVGLGLRISIPQLLGPVPLAFDFAFPILKEDGDRTRIFNFYVGFTK